MRLRFAPFYRKLAQAMTVCGVLLALMAGVPAKAGGRRPADKGPVNAADPFVSYNTELNVAASGTLRDLEVRSVAAPAAEAWSLPESPDIRPTRRGRSTRLGWERVERLLPVIAPILRESGVPVQLAAVVLVESGGDPTALSPKGARGLWQLMPDTAREYGLTVNLDTDQRLDVVKSTRAAAGYLRDLYGEFGNWKLALAAYNAGDKAVWKAMARTGGDGFSSVASALPEETQSYVPKVMHSLDLFGSAGMGR